MTTSRITAGHFAAFDRDGYFIVPAFVTPDELAEVRTDLAAYFPDWETYVADPSNWPEIEREHNIAIEAPFKGHVLNNLMTHPELIAVAERLLGAEQVYLTQSVAWAKYWGGPSFEQPHHRDYHDNSLVMPRSDGQFSQLHMILYYVDMTDGIGPTCVVPRPESEGRPLVPYRRLRVRDPALYESEVRLTVEAGALVCFGARTIHRASGIREPGVRITHHLAWRAWGHEWMSWRGWAKYANTPEMMNWIQSATVAQRGVIGFPLPGHSYWNEESIELVAARYPAMDMTPYRKGLGKQ